MKSIYFLVLYFSCSMIYSQIEKKEELALPRGSVFKIELTQRDSVNYNHKIIFFYDNIMPVNFEKTDTLFLLKTKPNIIQGVFAKSDSKYGQFKTVLILRNNSKNTLKCSTKISISKNAEFYDKKIMKLYPGVNTVEMWTKKIYAILLEDFQIIN